MRESAIRRRLLAPFSFLLSAVLALYLIPLAAIAEAADDTVQVSVSATSTNGTFGSVSINGVSLLEGTDEPESFSTTKTVPRQDSDDIVVQASFGLEIESVTINGTSYAPASVDQCEASVPHADSYAIDMVCKSAPPAGALRNLSWTDNDDFGPDGKLSNGRVVIDGVVLPDGTQLSESELLANGASMPNLSREYSTSGGKMGNLMVPAGTQVTLKIVPDAGYQVTTLVLNGGTSLSPSASTTSQFTMTMPDTELHLSAMISAMPNVVSNASSRVSSGSVGYSGSSIKSGTARLNVSDIGANAAISQAAANAGYRNVSSYIGLSLDNVVYKGTTTDAGAWSSPLSELNGSADITLSLSDAPGGSAVTIFHEKHDGSVEQIPARYNASTRSVSFSATSFSDYAIAVSGSTVTYDANGGDEASVPAAQPKNDGEAIVLSEIKPTRADESAEHTVSYDANGGSPSPDAQKASCSSTFEFVGWNTAADGSGDMYQPGDEYSVDGDATLYAQWRETKKADAIVLAEAPSRTGYTFVEWNTKQDGSGTGYAASASITPNADMELYAQWRADAVGTFDGGFTQMLLALGGLLVASTALIAVRRKRLQ